MSYFDTMKLGFVSSAYPPPPEFPRSFPPSIEATKWHMTKTYELGGGVTQMFLPADVDQAALEDLKEHAVKNHMEIELAAPLVPQRGEDKEEVKKRIETAVKNAKFLDVKILRGAYGRLKVEVSRFNKDWPLKEHMQYVTDCLKFVAPYMESEGLYFALENHCDFTGKEFAEMFTAVNSKHIGCTLDSANGFTVFCDPNEDVEYLAEFALTTHLKDMLVQDCKTDLGLPMFQARGCALGDGHVNIPRCLELLDKKSPMRDGLHLVIEHGWMNMDGIEDRDEYNRKCLEKGLAYLKKCIGRA